MIRDIIKDVIRDTIGSSIKPVRSGSGTSYDYIITNDAEWTSTFALGATTLSGKTIGVAPGNYTSKTIASFNPSSPVTLISTSGTRPIIDQLVIDGSGNLVFDNLKIVTSVWQTGNSISVSGAAVALYGANGDLTFKNCRITGNYRGVPDEPTFDPSIDTYPEYAAISPNFNSSGVITSFTIERATVGDLLADGTHNMVFNSAVTGASATFTVSGGQIVSTTLINGGTSSYNASTGIGIRSQIISWTGQRRMINWLPNPFRGDSGSVTQKLRIEDCEIALATSAIKPGSGVQTWEVIGNYFDLIYQDYFSIGIEDPVQSVTITDNFGTRPFSKAGDPGDPHSDYLQFFMSDSVPYSEDDWPNVVIERNVFVDGSSRGGVQGMIIADAPYITANSKATAFSRWRIVGNLVASKNNSLGINMVVPRDCYVANNACVFWSDSGNTAAKYITLSRTLDSPHGGPYAYGNSLCKNNVTELINRGVSDNRIINLVDNVQLGLNGSTIPYSSVFANHSGSRTTLSEIVAAYTPKAGYENRGPFGNTAYIDHINRTTDRSLEASYVAWDDLSNQATSTLVTSSWGCLVSGQNGRTISITNGEYRLADDENGTNATSWTSASGTIDVWKYIQLRHTTSNLGSRQVVTTVTIGSDSFNWRSTTQSVLLFTAVDNGGTAYSSTTLPSNEANIRKLLIVARFKADTISANANIIANLTAASPRIWFPTTSTMRGQFIASNRANLRPSFTPNTTDTVTHFISLDFTNTNANQGCIWATDLSGVILNNTPGTGGTFDTRTVAGSGTDYGSYVFPISGAATSLFGSSGGLGLFAESDGGGVLFDGDFEFLWMDWGTSSYSLLDITDSAVRTQFTADLIGANGEEPTGESPKLFYTGSAAEWNAGLANKGSLILPLTKQAGTYV